MMGNDPTQFSPHPQGNNQQSNESNMQFPNDTPNMPFGPNVPQNSNKMPNFMDQKPGDVCSRHNQSSIFCHNNYFIIFFRELGRLNFHRVVDDRKIYHLILIAMLQCLTQNHHISIQYRH